MKTFIKDAYNQNDNFMGAISFDSPALDCILYWDGKKDTLDKCVCSYEMYLNDKLLFKGNDYYLSPFHTPDSFGAFLDLLFFLSLRPGDTDSKYFANYTTEQKNWSNSFACEVFQLTLSDIEEKNTEEIGTKITYYNILLEPEILFNPVTV